MVGALSVKTAAPTLRSNKPIEKIKMIELTEADYISRIASKNWKLSTAESSATYQVWRHKTNSSYIELNIYVDKHGDIEVHIYLYS